MQDNFPLQRQLFETIKEKSGKPRAWCTEYQKQVFLSKSAAYKKVNGNHPISFDEGVLLMKQHGITFEELKVQEDTTLSST
jgi:hypothetical protein